MFFPWKDHIRNDVGLYSVQLPGRENRITEECYRDIDTAADDLTKELLNLMNKTAKPICLFGHSMDEQYVLQDKVKLSCPIFAFYGANDSEADGKDMDKWKIYTDSFGIKQFEGKQKRCLNKKRNVRTVPLY